MCRILSHSSYNNWLFNLYKNLAFVWKILSSNAKTQSTHRSRATQFFSSCNPSKPSTLPFEVYMKTKNISRRLRSPKKTDSSDDTLSDHRDIKKITLDRRSSTPQVLVCTSIWFLITSTLDLLQTTDCCYFFSLP